MLVLIKHYRGSTDGLEGLPEKRRKVEMEEDKPLDI
jgi:hypothetical protein